MAGDGEGSLFGEIGDSRIGGACLGVMLLAELSKIAINWLMFMSFFL